MCRAQQSGGTFKSRKAASIMEFLSMPKNGFNHVQKWGANDGEIDCYHTEPVYNEMKCLRLTKAILTNKYRRFESQQFWKGNKTTRKKHEIRHFFFSSLVVFSLFWGRTKLFTRLDSRSSKLMFHFFFSFLRWNNQRQSTIQYWQRKIMTIICGINEALDAWSGMLKDVMIAISIVAWLGGDSFLDFSSPFRQHPLSSMCKFK